MHFCLQELESLAETIGVTKSTLYLTTNGERPPITNPSKLAYLRVHLPTEEHARQLTSRSILIKNIIDEIGKAPTLEMLIESGLDREKLSELADKRFMFKVEGLGRTIQHQEQMRMIDAFEVTDLRQEMVDLDEPEVCFRLLDDTRNNTMIFGREVSSQRDRDKQSYFARFDLSKRPYLGPTSTDHELAFLMANLAKVSPGDLVYDPFCGSGSIAIACAHFGANVMGSDLDQRVLRGWGVGRKTYNTEISEQVAAAVQSATARE